MAVKKRRTGTPAPAKTSGVSRNSVTSMTGAKANTPMTGASPNASPKAPPRP